ncbi:hypothetical protein JCM8097_004752 [Rhodosporidiobolus ruineniae]
MFTPLTNEQLDALTDQEVVDYLCTAVEELDVLYVEIWLRRLKSRGVRDGVTRNHSWGNVSAVSLAGSAEQSVLTELVLHLLLFRLPTLPKGVWTEEAYSDLGLPSKAVPTALSDHREGSTSTVYLAASELIACANQNDPRVRIAPVFSTTALRMLPELEGMKGAELFGEDTAELSFRNLVDAEAARKALDGTYSSRLSPAPPADHPIDVHLSNLPPHVLSAELISILHANDIVAYPYSLRFGPSLTEVSLTEVSLTVANRAAYDLTLSRLDGNNWPGTQRPILVERTRPDTFATADERRRHPMVVVDGLGGEITAADVIRLAKSTRCGAYAARADVDESVDPLGMAVRGSFRTSSPFAAEQAARALDGVLVGGRRVRAMWITSDELGKKANQSVERDRGGVTTAVPGDEEGKVGGASSSSVQPSSTLSGNLDDPPSAQPQPPFQLPSPSPSLHASPPPNLPLPPSNPQLAHLRLSPPSSYRNPPSVPSRADTTADERNPYAGIIVPFSTKKRKRSAGEEERGHEQAAFRR